MNTHGFVEEDDLILYAMQALSPQEMETISRRLGAEPALAQRLRSIEDVLGTYAAATVPMQDVPPAALARLTSAIAPAPPPEAAAVPVRLGSVALDPKPSWGMRLGWLWAGWAVAAMLLIGLALQYRQGRRTQESIAAANANLQNAQTNLQSTQSSLQAAQQQVAAMSADRSNLQNSLQHASSEAEANRKQADLALGRSANLDAKATGAKLRADREAARADQLAADARTNADQRDQLNAALAREQQVASQAADSQQVLAALADPTALHVTLTVPKQKKHPSGRGTYLASNGTLVFTGSDLEPLPAGKVYQLWLMPADGSAPIPAGTFSPDASGGATLIASHFQSVSAKGFAITAEPAGGSLKPTLPILLLGGA